MDKYPFSLLMLTFILLPLIQEAFGQWDLNLICPEDWHAEENVTLLCKINSNIYKSKCDNPTNVTATFSMELEGEEKEMQCIIPDLMTGGCINKSSRMCWCQGDKTSFEIAYQFVPKLERRSKWTCDVQCILPSGPRPVLQFVSTPSCSNVFVKYRVLPGDWDLFLTCPEQWYAEEKVTLVCAMNRKTVWNKCQKGFANATFYRQYDGLQKEQQCSINEQALLDCNYTMSTLGCGCQSNDTHSTLIYQFVAMTGTSSSWSCQLMCTDVALETMLFESTPTCSKVLVKNGESDSFASRVVRASFTVSMLLWIMAVFFSS